MKKPLLAVLAALTVSISAFADYNADLVSRGALLPDIVDAPPSHLNVMNSQQREILRFTTEHINIGDGPLQVRSDSAIGSCTAPDGFVYDFCTASTQEVLNEYGQIVYTQPAGVAVFHPEHNHWHQDSVADFTLRWGSVDGPVLGSVLKTTYCLIDYDKTELVHENSSRVYFDCNGETQGISVGWSDEYHHATHGQSIEITGLPAGIYYLVYTADPLNKWIETDETNNTAWTAFELSRKGANPEVREIGRSACMEGITCGSNANK